MIAQAQEEGECYLPVAVSAVTVSSLSSVQTQHTDSSLMGLIALMQAPNQSNSKSHYEVRQADRSYS